MPSIFYDKRWSCWKSNLSIQLPSCSKQFYQLCRATDVRYCSKNIIPYGFLFEFSLPIQAPPIAKFIFGSFSFLCWKKIFLFHWQNSSKLIMFPFKDFLLPSILKFFFTPFFYCQHSLNKYYVETKTNIL